MTPQEPRGFRESLERLSPIPDAEWQALVAELTPQKLVRGEVLVKLGDLDHKSAYVESGVLRAYYVTPNGDEATRNFTMAGDMIGPYASALSRTPSNVVIEALEDTSPFWIPYARLEDLFARHPAWQVVARRTAERFYLIRERHGYQLLMHTAEERYESFLKEFPQLADRIPLKYVASYLGIAPESLSRLRKKRR